MRSRLVSEVEDPEFRSICGVAIPTESDPFVDIILKLVELVEKRISTEMTSTVGSLVFEVCSCSGKYYVGIFSSCCVEVSVMLNVMRTLETHGRRTLIAVSPVCRIPM